MLDHATLNDDSFDKTLDQALDEMDLWGEQLSERLNCMSQDEIFEHFCKSQTSLEEFLGKKSTNSPQGPFRNPAS